MTLPDAATPRVSALGKLLKAYPGGALIGAARATAGPYYLLALTAPWEHNELVGFALSAYPGVPLPIVFKYDGIPTVTMLGVHAVPAFIRDLLVSLCARDVAAEAGPFPAPPGGSELAAMAATLMTPVDCGTADVQLPAVVYRACTQVGVQAVTALIDALDQDVVADLEQLTAVLAALTTDPTRTR